MEQNSSITKKIRKYDSEYRKKLISKIEKIITSRDLMDKKDKSNIISIYNIINEDIANNFSSNRNGLFINMNLLSDKCIENIIKFIEDKQSEFCCNILTQTDSEVHDNILEAPAQSSNYKIFKSDDVEFISEMGGQKLSTMEKNIIKRIRNKST